MDEHAIRQLLQTVKDGTHSVDEAVARLRSLPFEDIGFAKIDHHRGLRCGFPEIVYAEGKSTEQILAILGRSDREANILITRADPAVFDAVASEFHDARYNEPARAITLRRKPPAPAAGTVGLITAGTSDISVAEEARATLDITDQNVEALYDVGVAGLHRLLAHTAVLQRMDVLIVVAGMEGALPSVVGGLVDVPVIAVPTSVGYGASFGGIAALLGMLNSCASGVTVVNIDNGFGAGFAAALMLRRMHRLGKD
ncbi:MAG: nickel pincer cofactor biosynthesis protein LarB [Phycisphaerae bacterium]